MAKKLVKVPRIFRTYLGIMRELLDDYNFAARMNKPLTAASYEYIYNTVREELLKFTEFAIESGSLGVYLDSNYLVTGKLMASDEEAEFINEYIRDHIRELDNTPRKIALQGHIPKQW